jgi:hypothetical protein
VITLQTDGPTNFDAQVPVCFPNLPSAETGLPLPPGEASALWSFNHDSGIWEIAGSMTVSDDGSLVCSDPGSGLRAPGWHGSSPGTSVLVSVLSPGKIIAAIPTALIASAWSYFNDDFSQAIFAQLATDLNDLEFQKLIGSLQAAELGGKVATTYLDWQLEKAVGKTPVNVSDLFSLLQVIAQAKLDEESVQQAVGEFAFKKIGTVLLSQNEGVKGLFTLAKWTENSSASIAALQNLFLLNGEVKTGWSGFSDAQGDINKTIFDTAAALDAELPLLISGFSTLNSKLIAAKIDLEAALSALDNPAPGTIFTALTNAEQALGDAVTELTAYEQAAASMPSSPAEPVVKLLDSIDGWFPDPPQWGEESLAPVVEFVPVGGGTPIQSRANADGDVRVNLTPDQAFTVNAFDPVTLRTTSFPLTTGPAGLPTPSKPMVIAELDPADADGDGLSDKAESILGTSPASADTDADGASDLAEVQQSTDPLDGVPALTGITSSVRLPGLVGDVCAINDTAIVALPGSGITVLNVFNGMDPVAVAQVETLGTSDAVTCSGELIPVADGVRGLAILDVSDPPVAFVRHQLILGSIARAVASSAGIAYVGLNNGQVVSVDMATGTILESVTLDGALQDLSISRDVLYAVTNASLHAIALGQGELASGGASALPGTTVVSGGRLRAHAGSEYLYVTHRDGFSVFDLSVPLQPTLVIDNRPGEFGWKQIVPNGSGLGFAAVGLNTSGPPQHVSLYDLSSPGSPAAFITEFETPGDARAVSIFNGLGYVADDSAGLQVVNYRPYDAFGIAPTITFELSFDPAQSAEGSVLRATALVTDDVQVRNVEFFIDGERAVTDGSFPFEYRFVAPLLINQPSFTLEARATDTGGNSTTTGLITTTLVPDMASPEVIGVVPADRSFHSDVGTVAVTFSEAIKPATLAVPGFELFEAGVDGQTGTGDDVPVPVGSVEFRSDVLGAFANFDLPLPPGTYRAVLGTSVTDLAGNGLTVPFQWTFTVFDRGTDTDLDCVPDAVEIVLGLDPSDEDSDDDGTLDGSLDGDGDGLFNCQEVLAGIDPTKPDTDGDGLRDDEEYSLGLSPNHQDTDQDGLNDSAELVFGSSPLDDGDFVTDPVVDGASITLDGTVTLNSLTLVNGARCGSTQRVRST